MNKYTVNINERDGEGGVGKRRENREESKTGKLRGGKEEQE